MISIALASLLIGSKAAGAWDYDVTLEKGGTQNCGPVGPHSWKVEVTGTTFKGWNSARPTIAYTFDIASLKPDGSGRIITKTSKNVTVYFDFVAGAQPTVFYISDSVSPCVFLGTPRAKNPN